MPNIENILKGRQVFLRFTSIRQWFSRWLLRCCKPLAPPNTWNIVANMWNLCPTSPPGEGVWEGVVVVRWQCRLHRPAPLQCQIYERRAPWLSPSVGGCRHNCAQSREILASLGIHHPQSGYTDPKSADTWHPSSFLPTLITILELNSNRNFNSNELTILVNELSFEMDNWNKTRIKPMKEIGLCS